jgi:DNA repair protein RadC
MRPGVTLSSVATVRDFLRFQLGRLEHESFGVVMLDAQHRLIAYRKLFRGTLSHSAVHAREVVKEALACNAAGVILCHNHPSGWVEPSARDVEVTRALQQSLALVDIHVIDHLVVAGFEVTSFLERGLRQAHTGRLGIERVPRHDGYPMQPQNSLPLFAPRWAVRFTIGLAHAGHVAGSR